MVAVLDEVQRLVERFDSNLDSYRSGRYNETQVRREFVDPLFAALGWDIDNRQGLPEAFKEVVHEDRVKVAAKDGKGATKAPDYGFWLGGNRKFFLEAKKPSVNIRNDQHPAFQLRRYAWSAKLPLSILTDFEEFAVYDCRFRPKKGDEAAVARVCYYTFRDYLDQWDAIAGTFSREAVEGGSLDKFAEQKKPRGTSEVDDAFLNEIEAWREMLAKNLASRNSGLTRRELNSAVQKTIDRIIFLRICEDRGIEPYGRLRDLRSGGNIYPRLGQLFQQADDRYNSGLFHFKRERGRPEEPDTFTLGLTIDDEALDMILGSLYYPESPYEFSVLPADILGQVYEQFLGKVITLDGTSAVVEEKPEVKKAGGVYYTPTYIVDYIVKQTVGRLLEGKTPIQISADKRSKSPPLRILDPACGSGSFLIEAYQYLLDWHLQWYVEDGSEKHARGEKAKLYRGPSGDWRLTTDKRKRILLTHIYGVDIDPQAVEVTKLSLLLKVLEGENEQSINRQMMLFQERVLPDLSNNIKCGNSLIGSDYFSMQESMFDEEEQYRINAFDWDKEFPEAIGEGGFGVLLGNPPWGAEIQTGELEYLRHRFKRVVDRMVDSYIYFIDQAMRLADSRGVIGFIVPSTLLNQTDATSVRELLLKQQVTHLVSLGQGVFGTKVLNTSTIFVTRRDEDQAGIVVQDLSSISQGEKKMQLHTGVQQSWSQWRNLVETDPSHTFFVNGVEEVLLLKRMRAKYPSLGDVVDGKIQRGVTPDHAAMHILSAEEVEAYPIEREPIRLSVSGSQIKRYQPWRADQYLIYTTGDTPIEQYPNLEEHMLQFKEKITCKEVKVGKHPWWRLHRPRNSEIFESPKLIGLTTSRTIELIYDEDGDLVVTDAMYVFKLRSGIPPSVALAVLQSKAFLFFYRVANQGESRVIPQVKASKLKDLPFPTATDANIRDKIRDLAESMMQLTRQLSAARDTPARVILQRRLESTDQELDRLVYKLYSLAPEEIEIVEGTMY